MLLWVFLVAFCVLTVQAAPLDPIDNEKPHFLQYIEDISRKCSSQLKITSELPKMTSGQFPEDNKELNALFGCVWVELGIVDENGTVDEDKLKEYLTNVSTMFIPSVIKNCKDVEATEPGQKAIKLQNCMVMYNLKLLKKYYS